MTGKEMIAILTSTPTAESVVADHEAIVQYISALELLGDFPDTQSALMAAHRLAHAAQMAVEGRLTQLVRDYLAAKRNDAGLSRTKQDEAIMNAFRAMKAAVE